MKVVKELHHGLLLNYFGLNDKFYAVVTIMTFFSFDNPDNALSEQEMWPFIQGELGKDAVFDMAMPKPLAEVLVHGCCFAPEGKPRVASQVAFRVGDIGKTLNVYGNRTWRKAAGAMMVITDPEPFKEMPIRYELAFGGKDYAKNPVGRGFAPVTTATGEMIHPLPNIELPDRLIGSPTDRPEPAGFGPYDFTWPQRSKKQGTYDDRWMRERWPYFPDDMNWTYYNAAPDDQQTDAFFRGGEAVAVTNMHRGKQLLQFRLPLLRQRCFLNQLEDYRKPEGEKTFREVTPHIDTVWLFPHAERGVLVHRGVAEVKDDEGRDIQHLFLVTEAPGEAPQTIEHYLEELKKRLDRKVPAELEAARAEMKKKMAEVHEHLLDLPQRVDDGIAKALGQAPIPARTPKEIVAGALKQIEQQGKLLGEGEKRLWETKAKYGHFMKIDLSGFDRARRQIAEAKVRLAEIPAKVDAIQAKHDEAMAKTRAMLKDAQKRVTPEILKEKGGADPEGVLDSLVWGPKNLWHDRGMRFLEECRENMKENEPLMNALRELGFRRYTLERSWLGVHPLPEDDDPGRWRLPEVKPERKDPQKVSLPAGFVIPRFDNADLHRIKVRPLPQQATETGAEGTAPSKDDYIRALLDSSRDVLIEGSKEMVMTHGMEEGKPIVRVADELEAILLFQEARGLCTVAAMKTPGDMADKDTAEFLKKAPQLLVVLYPASKEAADRDIALWQKAFPQAEPLSLPDQKSLFKAKKEGISLWHWIAEKLKPDLAPDPEAAPKEIDLSQPGAVAAAIPKFDVPALIKKARGGIMARMQPKIDMIEAKKKEMEEMARKRLIELGKNPDEVLKKSDDSVVKADDPPAVALEKMKLFMTNQRQALQKQGAMTPEMTKKIDEAEAKLSGLLTESSAFYKESMARLADAQAQVKAGMPDWGKKLLVQAGVDPEDPAPLRILSRDEVIEKFKKGLSLEGKNLTGVDLSGLELPGIILRRANLQKAKLAGCNLDGADLTGAIANEADFSKASLKEAKMSKGLFQKAKFVEAKMQLTDMTQAVMSEADLSGADLTGALLEKALLEKAKLVKAKLTDAKIKQGYFLSADVSQANFSGADITKAVFLKANIDQVNFSGGAARGTIFIEAKGGKLNFSGADMYNSRIINDSAMTDSDFTNVKAERACWMRSDLSGSDFRNSDIKRGLVEECNLAGTNLAGVSAKQARLTKTDLSDANLQGMNMLFGSLRKSKLVRTDLRKANLYGVEFYRTGVGDTKFDEANLKMTKLHKRTDLIPGSKPGEKRKGSGSTRKRK